VCTASEQEGRAPRQKEQRHCRHRGQSQPCAPKPRDGGISLQRGDDGDRGEVPSGNDDRQHQDDGHADPGRRATVVGAQAG
jgi:hypothetical protein